MDPITAIGLIITVIQTAIKAAPVIIEGIKDLKVFAADLFQKFTGKSLTDEQRKELEDKIDALHNEFQQPIPPESDQ